MSQLTYILLTFGLAWNALANDPEQNFDQLLRQRQRRAPIEQQAGDIQTCLEMVQERCGPIAVKANGEYDFKLGYLPGRKTASIFYANLKGGGAAKSRINCWIASRYDDIDCINESLETSIQRRRAR